MVLTFPLLPLSYRSTSSTLTSPFPKKLYTKTNPGKKYSHIEQIIHSQTIPVSVRSTLNLHLCHENASQDAGPSRTAREQRRLLTLTPPRRAINTLIRWGADRRARVSDTTTLRQISISSTSPSPYEKDCSPDSTAPPSQSPSKSALYS
jgi:hypothetical protein